SELIHADRFAHFRQQVVTGSVGRNTGCENVYIISSAFCYMIERQFILVGMFNGIPGSLAVYKRPVYGFSQPLHVNCVGIGQFAFQVVAGAQGLYFKVIAAFLAAGFDYVIKIIVIIIGWCVVASDQAGTMIKFNHVSAV